MPTRGRSELAKKAVDYFLAQTWPNKELLILDDEDVPAFDIAPDGCQLYQNIGEPLTIGAKRNWLCAVAKGEIIAHWDSDDYSAPTRLAEQYQLLESSGKAVTAFHSMIFIDEIARQAAKYLGDPGDICGTSLMYRREYWLDHPFLDIMIQEDLCFSRHAEALGELHSADANGLMIARTHGDNTSPRSMVGETWQALSFDTIAIL